jgi:ribosome-associated protein
VTIDREAHFLRMIDFLIGRIAAMEVQFEAVRSRGPGGQNINKVSSAACLYWNYLDSLFLSIEQKSLIRTKLANFINRDHQVFLRSDEFRDLERNKSRCIEKLKELLKIAFHKPKTRKPTKPTRASKERKRVSKSHRSKVKSLRRSPVD